MASSQGHLNVVNRLLDSKEIDVNVQAKVCGNVLILSHSRVFPNSRPILFGCGFLMRILFAGKQKQNVE